MDFLDPKKRRSHHIRLMIGYVLIAIAIGLGTVILVYDANGYGINAKTGDIVQNGLLFVDSKPGGSDIYQNGKVQNSTTSARLILPAGAYNLTLKKSGYRTWSRSFTLIEHSIARYVYPLLVPDKLTPKTVKTYTGVQGLISQSPDQRWLLLQNPAASSSGLSFDEYDTTDVKSAPKSLVIPQTVFINTPQTGAFVEVEWASDNNHLLMQHIFPGGSEFIILDRENPSASISLNRLFNLNPAQAVLRNKKIDQVYLYDQAAATLQIGDTAKATLGEPILHQVLAFKAYGNDLVSYVTDTDAPIGQAEARIWNSSKTYPLYEFNAGDQYFLDIAQSANHWYYVAGSNKADRINIYKDPLDKLKDPSVKKASPLIALHLLGATKLSFSTNARFIEAEAGQKFSVYDSETASSYSYTLAKPISANLQWMDGHRLIGISNGNAFLMDYDNINQQVLVPTALPEGGLFDRDFNQLFTTVAGTGSFSLQISDMRAGSDLPN